MDHRRWRDRHSETPNACSLAASAGDNFLDLAGYTNGGFPKGISQVLAALPVGQACSFSMDLGIRNGACVGGGNNCHGPVRASASIGSITQTFIEAFAVAGNVWSTFGFDFVATGPSMTLTIDGVSVPAGNEFIGLDNVSVAPAVVTPVPEQLALSIVSMPLPLQPRPLSLQSSRRRSG